MASRLSTLTIPASVVGIDGLALNTPRDSAWIDVSGFSQLTLKIKHTYSAATNLTFKLELTDNNSSPGVTEIGAVKIGNDAGSGTVNYYEQTFTIPSISASRAHFLAIPIAYKYLRVKGLTGASAGAGDTAIVSFTLTVN